MTKLNDVHTGGCLCGALRYEASGEPLYAGLCYCADCRKATGSAFVAFMGYPASHVRFTGEATIFVSKSARGTNATRSSCPVCNSLVFGGERGKDTQFTLYAGSLDDPTVFQPTIAIFAGGRPAWALIPPHLKVFEGSPGA